jgi:hypothetical protein
MFALFWQFKLVRQELFQLCYVFSDSGNETSMIWSHGARLVLQQLWLGTSLELELSWAAYYYFSTKLVIYI